VGTAREAIRDGVTRLLADADAYSQMAVAKNPYGDGTAARRLVEVISGAFAITGNSAADTP